MENSNPAEIERLRAEVRRRKILERGDERIRKLFGESISESTNSQNEDDEKRNKNLLEKIIKDKEESKKLNNVTNNEVDSNLVKENIKKPLIDFSYFENLENKEKIKQQRSDISITQLFILNLISLVTFKKNIILISFVKSLIALVSSYFSLNIVTPFIISQSIGFMYNSHLNFNDQSKIKFLYKFIKENILDSFYFIFVYIIVQSF